MRNNDISRPKVILDGKQAEQELDKLTQKANKYRDAMLQAASVGDSKAEKQQAANFKAASKEISNFKKEALSVESVLKNINGASFNEISQASRKAAADLRKMKQTDPGYADQKRDVSLLKDKLRELGQQSGANISLWENLKNTASGLLPAFGFAALAGAAVSAFTKIKNSTHATSDAFEFSMAAMNNGIDHFWKSLATGDWTNFSTRMKEAIETGYKYASMLDEVDDKTRALSMVESDARGEELKLEEKLKNKGLGKAAQIQAGKDRIALEQKLSLDRQNIANERFDAEVLLAQQQTQLSRDQLIQVAKDIDSKKKLEAQAYNDKVTQYNNLRALNTTRAGGTAYGGATVIQNDDTPEMKALKTQIDTTEGSVKEYAGFMKQYDVLTLEQQEKFVSAYVQRNEAINSAPENLKKVITKVNNLLAGVEDDGKKIEDQSAKEKKEAADKAIEILDAANNKRNAKIIDQYINESWTDERFKAEQLAAEQAYLIQKKALLIKFGQSTVDVDNQINQKRIEAQKESNAIMTDFEKESVKMSDDNQKSEDEILKAQTEAQINAVNQYIDKSKELKDKEAEILKQRQESILQFSMMVGQSFGDLISSSESSFADYLKNVLVMSLEALHQFFLIEKYKAIIKGAAEGPWGWAAAAAEVVAIEIAYQTVKGLLTKGKQAGGYAETGSNDSDPDGIYHKNEFIVSAPAVRNPTVKPILDIINLAQKDGTIATLNIQTARKALFSRNYGPIEGSSFGYSNRANGSINPSEASIIDQKQNELLDRINTALDNNTKATALLMKRGVEFPIVPFIGAFNQYSDLLSQTGMPGFKGTPPPVINRVTNNSYTTNNNTTNKSIF